VLIQKLIRVECAPRFKELATITRSGFH